jgi:hypothetical protein
MILGIFSDFGHQAQGIFLFITISLNYAHTVDEFNELLMLLSISSTPVKYSSFH